jgi:hypothetical protein
MYRRSFPRRRDERIEIADLHRAGLSIRQIALWVPRTVSQRLIRAFMVSDLTVTVRRQPSMIAAMAFELAYPGGGGCAAAKRWIA